MQVVCIRHPKYKGDSAPVLSCRVCCGIFVAEIRARHDAQKFEPIQDWLERKATEARGYNPKK